jgi:hypothetical protein
MKSDHNKQVKAFAMTKLSWFQLSLILKHFNNNIIIFVFEFEYGFCRITNKPSKLPIFKPEIDLSLSNGYCSFQNIFKMNKHPLLSTSNPSYSLTRQFFAMLRTREQ